VSQALLHPEPWVSRKSLELFLHHDSASGVHCDRLLLTWMNEFRVESMYCADVAKMGARWVFAVGFHVRAKALGHLSTNDHTGNPT
jgi:hypothetical protein